MYGNGRFIDILVFYPACRPEVKRIWQISSGLILQPGAYIPPETMMHFPPCFRFPPYFRKILWLWRKIFTILPFPDKFLDFHPL